MTDAPTIPATPSSAAPAAAAPPSPPAAAPAAASPPTPAPGTTPTASASRPEYISEAAWDSATNAPKVDVLLTEFEKTAKERNEFATRIAADDSRKASLPQTPEAYELKLPETFKAPDGIEVKFDANDPMLKSAQAMAHAKGWSQADFSDALGVVAAMKAGEAAQYEALKTANLADLGAKGPERIDAVTRWLAANFGENTIKPVLATLATTAHVEMFEKIISKMSSQGTAPFSQSHRDVNTGKVDDATWDKMSYSEKKAYTAKHSSKAA